MKVKELITMLQSMPPETQDKDVIIQYESRNYSLMGWLNRVYYVLQNQYMAKEDFSHRITQDEYDSLKDDAPNDFYLVKKDFEPWLPAFTVFALSEVVPDPEPQEKSKEDLIKESIAEGGIPHLSVVRE